MISDFNSVNQFDVLPQKVMVSENKVSEEILLFTRYFIFQFSLLLEVTYLLFFYFRFEICRKLGQGTYGKVQLGINKETGQQVSLKSIEYFLNIIDNSWLG